MSKYDDNITLRQILDHAREAVAVVDGQDESVLDEDRLLYLAVTRLLSIVGEAATRLSQQRRKQVSQISWRQIIGLRNVLMHAYDVIDNPTLWNILTKDLPQLIKKLEQLDLPKEAE